MSILSSNSISSTISSSIVMMNWIFSLLFESENIVALCLITVVFNCLLDHLFLVFSIVNTTFDFFSLVLKQKLRQFEDRKCSYQKWSCKGDHWPKLDNLPSDMYEPLVDWKFVRKKFNNKGENEHFSTI